MNVSNKAKLVTKDQYMGHKGSIERVAGTNKNLIFSLRKTRIWDSVIVSVDSDT